jgi:hypothetical protein
MPLDIIGTPNPKTDHLVKLHGQWFWPCNAWLGLLERFGEEAVLNAAGNSDEPINPATIHGKDLYAFTMRVAEELRAITAIKQRNQR